MEGPGHGLGTGRKGLTKRVSRQLTRRKTRERVRERKVEIDIWRAGIAEARVEQRGQDVVRRKVKKEEIEEWMYMQWYK
jgi:hypothetical protein